MIHSENDLKTHLQEYLRTNHTCKSINLLNQPAQFNQQKGSNFKTFTHRLNLI